jgi:hypothetical protein
VKKTKKRTKTRKTTRAGKAKVSRKRSAVKKVSAKKAAAVHGGLPAVQKVREAAAQPQSLPTEPAGPNYSKTQV